MTEEFGELDALGTALDMMKATAEKTVRFYKHSMNKHVISPTAEPGFEPSYDPGASSRKRAYFQNSGILIAAETWCLEIL